MLSDLCQDKDKLKLQSAKILLVHPTYEIVFGTLSNCSLFYNNSHILIAIPTLQWFMVSYLYCSTQLSLRATTFEREIKKISKELFFNVFGDCWKKVFYKSLTILNEHKIFYSMFSHYFNYKKNMNYIYIKNFHSFLIVYFRSEYVNMTVV